MSWRHLKVIEGGRGDDLVTTIIRAIDMAKSSRSSTTVDLLKMALLNEGIRLAADLAPEKPATFSEIRKALSRASRLNLVNVDEQALPGWPSPLPEVARPRQSPVADHGCPRACKKHASIDGPVQSAHPIAKPSSNAAENFLASFPTRD
jgi:hypothetical protein